MLITTRKVAPPSDDKRWRLVEGTMRRRGHDRGALIEVLHSAQEAFGFLDEPALRYVAAALGVPPSRVLGVATFYHYFKLNPQGEHTCVVCTGTACYIKGSADLLAGLKQQFDLEPEATSADGRLSLMTARCLGACGLAPCAVVDGDVVGILNREKLRQRIAAALGAVTA